MNKPNKINRFMYGLMNEATKFDFTDFLEEWDISEEEYLEIEDWFKKELGVKL